MTLVQIFLWCGVLIAPVFISIFLLEGWMRPDYQPLRQAVSALSIGPRGWIQRANFFITAALALGYMLGLWLTQHGLALADPILVGIFGVGLLGAGRYVTDRTGIHTLQASPKQRSRSGVLHDLFSLPVFAALLIDCMVRTYLFSVSSEYWWALYSFVSGLLLLVFFFLAGAGFAGRHRFGGLMQRISIISGWVWLSVVAAHILSISH